MADTAISKAWGLAKRGDLDEALNLVGSQFDKEFGPTYLSRAMLGAIFVKAGQVERGLMALCVDWTQADADASGLAGAVLFGLARFDEALPALRHAVAGKPSDPGAHLVNLGRTLVYLGQAEEALPYLRRGVAQSTHDQVLAAQALAEALLALGRFEEALAALPQSNEDEEVVVSRAVVLAMSGRHDEAASFVAKEVERAPDSILLLLLQADLAEVCGRTGESINVLRKALEQDPEWAPSLQVLGLRPADLPNVTVIPTQPDMRSVYAQTKILLVPSMWFESGARVGIEAIANGIPVLVESEGGTKDLLGDGAVVIDIPKEARDARQNLMSEDQARPWYKALAQLYQDEAYFGRIAAQARAEASRLRKDEAAQNFLSLIA